jgi:hypothetical protein
MMEGINLTILSQCALSKIIIKKNYCSSKKRKARLKKKYTKDLYRHLIKEDIKI